MEQNTSNNFKLNYHSTNADNYRKRVLAKNWRNYKEKSLVLHRLHYHLQQLAELKGIPAPEIMKLTMQDSENVTLAVTN